jgi:hypothetical protein
MIVKEGKRKRVRTNWNKKGASPAPPSIKSTMKSWTVKSWTVMANKSLRIKIVIIDSRVETFFDHSRSFCENL